MDEDSCGFKPDLRCRRAFRQLCQALGQQGNFSVFFVGLGLQLWLPGLVLWIVGHSLAVWGASLDPQFMQVFARHIKHRQLLDV